MKITSHRVGEDGIFVYLFANSTIASYNVILSPFADCQTFALNSVASFFNYPKDQVLENLKYIRKHVCPKKQMICNVKEEYLGRLEAVIPPESFTIKEHYTSSNGSMMVMCLINLEFISTN